MHPANPHIYIHHVLHHVHSGGQGSRTSSKETQPADIVAIEGGNAGSDGQVCLGFIAGKQGRLHISGKFPLFPAAAHHLFENQPAFLCPGNILRGNIANASRIDRLFSHPGGKS
ncbi:hypothetical protein SDC9_200710 [bioreactor metagenome]|uniref:Uncharacterized protein n=1 Tax=bioreactor metagenome TaxID=1076179 RepID=A0A645IP79_9ZZZZ